MIDDIEQEEWMRAGVNCYTVIALLADGIIRATVVRPGGADRASVARSVWEQCASGALLLDHMLMTRPWEPQRERSRKL